MSRLDITQSFLSTLTPQHSPTSAMCTAATWFHRFYMRYSLNDFHRQVGSLVLPLCVILTAQPGRMLPQLVSFSLPKQKSVVGNSGMWREYVRQRYIIQTSTTSPLTARCVLSRPNVGYDRCIIFLGSRTMSGLDSPHRGGVAGGHLFRLRSRKSPFSPGRHFRRRFNR